MDESRRVQIEERIVVVRRMAAFAVPQDLASDAEWLMVELATKEATITRLLTEAERDAEVRSAINAEREQLKARLSVAERISNDRNEARVAGLKEIAQLRSELESARRSLEDGLTLRAAAQRRYTEVDDARARHVETIHEVRTALGLVNGQHVVTEAKAIREDRDRLRNDLATEHRAHDELLKRHQITVADFNAACDERDSLRIKLETQTKISVACQDAVDRATREQVERMKAIREGKLAERISRVAFDAQTKDPDIAKLVGNWESYHKRFKASAIIGAQAILADLAQIPIELPSTNEMMTAYWDTEVSRESYSAGAGRLVALLQSRLGPLLAAKNSETERLRLALETKTREWMAATTNGDNLKEQLRRLTSDLAAAESRAIKAERAVKLQLPSVPEMHEWFLDGYGDARSEVSSTQSALEEDGIRFLRNRLACLFGVKDDMIVTNDTPKTTTMVGLRQRFIAATKEDRCEVTLHRLIGFHDLLRLCDVIESVPCSSAEAITKVCATFAGTSFGVDPSTRTLQQHDWFAIGRELKKHLGYEPTVYSDRVELRDGRVWYDYEYQKLTFTMH